MPSQSPTGPPGLPRPPVTYSRRSATSHRASAARNGVDNEAKGEEAFERISRGARGGDDLYRTAARRATKANYRQQDAGAQSKQKVLPKSSVQAGKSAEKSDTPRLSATHSINDGEEGDMAEAIARSLGKTAGDPDSLPPISGEHDDSDIAEAKIMSLLSGNEPATPAAGGSSYKSIGSSSASSAIPPHTPLHTLLDHIGSTAKRVEELDPATVARTAPELVSVMRLWQNTVAQVLYATEAAEYKRTQDIQGHLDHDRDIEEKHRKKMNAFSKQCGAHMLQMQQDHQKELKKQKQMYENYISQHMAKPEAEPAYPRNVKSPSPHTQDEVDRLTKEITSLQSQHASTTSKLQGVHGEQVAFLQTKSQRLADANLLIRQAQENATEHLRQEMEKMKQAFAAQLQQIKDNADRLADENARLKQNCLLQWFGPAAPQVVARPPVLPPFIFTAGGRPPLDQFHGYNRSTRSDPGPSFKEGEGWARKRARYS